MKITNSRFKKEAAEKLSLPGDLLGRSLRGFRNKTKLKFRSGHYIVKTAENEWEAQKALALRKSAPPKESINVSKINDEFDFFDHDCDHLIVIEEEIGRVVGAVRLSSSFHGHSFPAAEDFHLDIFLTAVGHKLECGKVCVDPSFRNGTVVRLLMRGIAQYAKITNTRYLFGAIGAGPIEADSVVVLMKYLSDTGVGEFRYSIEPKANSQMTSLPIALTRFARQQTPGAFRLRRIPGFMRLLIDAGARICLSPAADSGSQGVRFFSLLDLYKSGR
jgi:hypothetical protein